MGNFDRFEIVRLLEQVGTKVPANEAGDRWSVSLINHFRMLVAYTRDADWHQGKPIVWLSVAETARKLNITRQQVNKNENRLMRLGAISWSDSPNHKRFGHRNEDGNITIATGVNLMPSVGLIEDLRRLLNEIDATARAFQLAKEQLTVLRRRCRSMVAWLLDQGLQNQIGGLAEEIERVISGISVGTKTRLEELESWTETLAGMIDRLKAIASPQRSSIEGKSSLPRDHQDLIQGSPKVDAQRVQSHSERNEEYSTNFRPNESDQGDVRKQLQREIIVHRDRGVDGRQAVEDSIRYSDDFDWPSFIEVLDESVAECLPARFDETDLLETGDQIRQTIGISNDAWCGACQTFGRLVAALIVMMIATKHRAGLVENPGGYLREVTRRHRAGTFRLWSMIYGLKNLRG